MKHPGSRPTATTSVTRHAAVSGTTTLAMVVLLLAALPVAAQVTAGGNFTWTEDDFDLTTYGAGNEFGAAVVTCDFDDDGFPDLAIGSPDAAFLGTIQRAGAVHVAYGGPDGLTLSGHQTLTQPPAGGNPPEADDHFGSALAAGDFNHDGYCDLAVGAPGEAIGPALGAGSVEVFSGSPGGLLTPPQEWTQGTPGVLDDPETGDAFGASLAAADFTADGFDDLAIGAPGENDAGGAVHVLRGSMEGLGTSGNDELYQGGAGGAAGTQEAGDQFGYSLAAGYFSIDDYADLAIGVPFEDAGGVHAVGEVQVFYGDLAGFGRRLQDTFDQPAIGLSPETTDDFGLSLAGGDFDGDGCGDLAIGSRKGVGPPGGEVAGAGEVIVLYCENGAVSADSVQVWSQDSLGIGDQAEENDFFGFAVTAADFDGDGFDDLAVGVPGEDFEGSSHMDNGALHVVYGMATGLSAVDSQVHGSGVWGVGAVEDNDNFGEVLATGDFDSDGVSDLVVGVPGENVGNDTDAGLVGVLTAQYRGLIFEDTFEHGDLSAWSAVAP